MKNEDCKMQIGAGGGSAVAGVDILLIRNLQSAMN
jgi:hypothetical protein